MILTQQQCCVENIAKPSVTLYSSLLPSPGKFGRGKLDKNLFITADNTFSVFRVTK